MINAMQIAKMPCPNILFGSILKLKIIILREITRASFQKFELESDISQKSIILKSEQI